MIFAPNALSSFETLPVISKESVIRDAARAVPTATEDIMRIMGFFWFLNEFLIMFSSITVNMKFEI